MRHIAFLIFFVLIANTVIPAESDFPIDKACLEKSFGQLPLHFIENQGQLDDEVAYYVQGSDKTLYFTATGLTFALKRNDQGPEPKQFLSINGLRNKIPIYITIMQ